jgi:TonB family protein
MALHFRKSSKRLLFSLVIALGIHLLLLVVAIGGAVTMVARANKMPFEIDPVVSPLMLITLGGNASTQRQVLTDRSNELSSRVATLSSSPVPHSELPKNAALESSVASDNNSWQAEYQRSSNLQKSPQPISEITPIYPKSAGKARGKVELQLFINEFGDVDKVLVMHATPAGLFDRAAIEAFEQARFSPGTLLGIPVKSQIIIGVSFTAFTVE